MVRAGWQGLKENWLLLKATVSVTKHLTHNKTLDIQNSITTISRVFKKILSPQKGMQMKLTEQHRQILML